MQPNGITVQEALQDAIEKLTGVRSGVIGCSRTDAGVHADMFCCTFDTECRLDGDKLAAALNYSETQARRILQEYTGKSFADNLRHHRITAAKQYLLNSNFSIDEIAERCGYQSRMGFENVFKKLVGMSPHRFRTNQNGQ